MDSQNFTEILLALLDIKKGESVLDAGCGTGNLTKKIYDITRGDVTGIDPSSGMINEAISNFGTEINFQLCSAEDLTFKNRFNVIFRNSAFQWISDAPKAVENFYHALKPGGRIGIQAPGGKEYSPNFLQAVEAVNNNEITGPVFKNFINPWMMLESAHEYTNLFMRYKFSVAFSEIQEIESFHTPDEVYKIFASGAIAGYLNKDYYSCKIDSSYINKFQDIVREDFNKQVNSDGKVKLVFNRIFLVAVKS